MTTDTGMVERCARAIVEETRRQEAEGLDIADFSLIARAVLECLRTPTPEMQVAGAHVCDQRPSEAGRVFTAMIDRALSPSKGEGE